MSWDLASERSLLADACRRDFELFCRVCLGFTHPQNKKGRWWHDPVHKPLCAWFQQQAEAWLARRDQPASQQQRTYLALIIPRNCAKSLLITQAGMLWLQLQDPNLSIFIGNEGLKLATEFLGSIKRWLEGSRRDKFALFNWLYGSWKSDDSGWRADHITHGCRTQDRAAPSFSVWSPVSALTGRHPDVLCMDDLVSYDALKTDSDWFNFAFSHMTDLIPVVEPNGLVILVGTRYGDADPFGRAFRTDGIATISGMTDFPEYQTSETGRWHLYFVSGKTLTGDPTIPTVWSKSEMDFYEGREPIKFAAQILNRPHAHSLRPLTEAQFDVHLTDDVPKKGFITIHLDTAFKSTSKMVGGSRTSATVVAHDAESYGKITVIDGIDDPKLRADTFADAILDLYRTWNPKLPVLGITDEREMAGKLGLWEQYLSDRFTEADLPMPDFFPVQRMAGERKETRIANAIAFIPKGQVRFLRSCPVLDELRKQLVNHPNAFPNDLADSFADSLSSDFFSGFFPKLKKVAEEAAFAAHEQRLKPWSFLKDDILTDDDLDRPPLRRSALRPDASSGRHAHAERAEAAAAFFYPNHRP